MSGYIHETCETRINRQAHRCLCHLSNDDVRQKYLNPALVFVRGKDDTRVVHFLQQQYRSCASEYRSNFGWPVKKQPSMTSYVPSKSQVQFRQKCELQDKIVCCADKNVGNGLVPFSYKQGVTQWTKHESHRNHHWPGRNIADPRSRIRKQRRIQGSDGPPSQQQAKMRVGSSSPENLPYLSNYSLSFWIPVQPPYSNQKRQVLAGTTEGHLVLFELSPTDDRVARMVALSANEDLSHKAVAFSHYHEQWFVILQTSGEKSWIRVYLRVGRGLERRQTILLEGESDFNLVNVKGVNYLSVVTFRNHSNEAGLFLYHWTKTQFDVIASRYLHGARSVATWVMDGSLYFAVATASYKEEGARVGSPIFFFNAKNGNKLVLQDMIATHGASKVLHFFVGGSHYVIFIGEGDAVIYWWSNDQFLFWQSLKGTAFASDVAVLELENGEVVIVIVLKAEALFLTLDASGQYYVSFTMLLSGFNLKSLQFMYTGKAYYALALSADYASHQAQHVWKMTLDPYFIPSRSALEPLHECLNDLADNLDKHQSEMNKVYNEIDRVWLKDKNQTITADVFITNDMKSPQITSITEVLILTTRKILPDSSLPLVAEGISKLKYLIDGIQQSIRNTVLKSTAQIIKGTKHFYDSIFIPSFNMQSTHIDVPINGVPVSRIYHSALKKVGNQTFGYPAKVVNVNSVGAETLFLNGIQMEDFLLLKSIQEVNGDLKFSNMVSTDLNVETINTIPIDSFVLTHTEQVIRDLKQFSALQANVINVQGQTNGEDLKEFLRKIVIRNEENELKDRYALESTVHVSGDLFIRGLVNGKFDISELKFNVVTRTEDQNLKGHFTFTSPIDILGDLTVSGHVNGALISDLVTLSTAQTIHGHPVFYELVTFDRDLIVDLVNGFDLDKTAVVKIYDPQFVSGLKTFAEVVVVDFIEMTDYVTLDGVDPSMLVQDIVKHEEGVVKNDGTVFHDVVVIGNVTALEGVNGHKIYDLPEIVWLKSVAQTIHVPVTTKDLTVKDLEVVSINDYHIEKDLVFTFTDETILSFKTFVHDVSVVQTVNTVEAKINGFDVVTFTRELEKYEKEGTIYGQKRLQTLEIEGNIELQNLNNLPLDNIMRPHVYQEIRGTVEFPSERTYIRNDLKANNIGFNVFNNNNLKDLENTVATRSPKEAVKNKALEKKSESVTINSPQQVLAEKVFLYPVHVQKASAVTLNGRGLLQLASRVVVTDQVANVTAHKSFTGYFQADNVFVHGLINGLDLSALNRNTFYKSLENRVESPMYFQNGITVGKLVTSALLDGIRWDNLISTNQNEVLDYMQLLSYTILNGHLVVGGLLNGCDLVELGQRALYSKKSDQLIKEEVTIETIEILGNLNLKQVVNEIPVEELHENFITVSRDQVIVSDFRLDNGFKVENLQIGDLTNHVSIPFILWDAVRHSLSQEIRGLKIFHDVSSSAMVAKEAFVLESLNDVDVTAVYSNAVWKREHQVITGEKIFHSLRTDIADIRGYLNGVRLPDDVVRTDTDDHVPGPTYFANNLVLPAGLHVDGRIDGVLLHALVESRVTLSAEEWLKSRLSFMKDVTIHGDLSVDGTVNNLVIEMVCRVRPQFPLHGFKVFSQDLHILGSTSAPTINGYDVQQMDSRILRKNREEFVNELQVFVKPLRASNSLYIESVNRISISNITSTYFSIVSNLHRTLNYFDDVLYGFHEQVTGQIEATRSRVSRFAYFTLVQEINMGPTTKILHAYLLEHASSEFSHSVIMWTTRRHCTYMERCCNVEMSHWVRVKKTGLLMVEAEATEGRLYPIHNPAPVMIDKDFVVWTNASEVQPKWCGNRYDETLSITLSGSSSFQAFISMRNAPLLSEIKSFSQGHLYAVAGFFYNRYEDEYSRSVVYVYNEMKREWKEHQILQSFGALSLDIAYYTDENVKELLLAVGTGAGTYSSVYIWNNMEHEFELLHNIPSEYVTSTLWVKQGSTQLLAMASVDHWPKKGDCEGFLSGGQVDIYTYKSREIRWIQSIPVRGVVSMITFDMEGDTYLAAASHQLQSIFIYEWRGYAGFSQVQSMFVGEVRHLSAYTIGEDYYLTVAVTSGPSKILKLVVQGRHSTKSSSRDQSYQDDQKDEASHEDQLVVPTC
ncbi:hypothetical protein JTE90_012823 [Oedothorax gibbosus]|uniref:Uncharacterized protein n=1 Tax=Oedothorax gibbosus TaxID=931172 RepID=A0AAV6VYG7_9ARAC|nr:hypothetical protein JTE90_012823 [Oedothorax gibbosus]